MCKCQSNDSEIASALCFSVIKILAGASNAYHYHIYSFSVVRIDGVSGSGVKNRTHAADEWVPLPIENIAEQKYENEHEKKQRFTFSNAKWKFNLTFISYSSVTYFAWHPLSLSPNNKNIMLHFHR